MTNAGRAYAPRTYESLESGCRRLYRAGPLREIAGEHAGKYLLLARDITARTRKIPVSIGYDLGGPFLGDTPDDAVRVSSVQKQEGFCVTTRFPIVLGGLALMLEYIRATEKKLDPLPVRSPDYQVKRATRLSEEEMLRRAGIRLPQRAARTVTSSPDSPWDAIVAAAFFGVDIRQ